MTVVFNRLSKYKYSLTLISERIWALANSKFKIIASINIRLGHTLIG